MNIIYVSLRLRDRPVLHRFVKQICHECTFKNTQTHTYTPVKATINDGKLANEKQAVGNEAHIWGFPGLNNQLSL